MKPSTRSTKSTLQAAAILLCLYPCLVSCKPKSDKILLSRVKSLTLQKDKLTTGRRLDPINQLTCIGGDAHGLHEVETMRCTNADSEYDDDDISWTCEANLPVHFKLGSTDVICEGYSSPDDNEVLKGSCGVEYRLMLTEAGHKEYDKKDPPPQPAKAAAAAKKTKKKGSSFLTSDFVLWLLSVFGFFIFLAYRAWIAPPPPPEPVATVVERPRLVARTSTRRSEHNSPTSEWVDTVNEWGSDPPPYDSAFPQSTRPSGSSARPTSSRRSTTSSSASSRSGSYARYYDPAQQRFQPGFWSGAASGAAAGYLANRAASSSSNHNANLRRESYDYRPAARERSSSTYDYDVHSPVPSRRASGYGSSSWDYPSTNDGYYDSTGFGTTRRR